MGRCRGRARRARGARGKGLVGKWGVQRPSAARRGSPVCARMDGGPRAPPHSDLGRRRGLPAGRAPSASSPYTLSRPGKFARVSDSFVKFPLGHRATLSPVSRTRSGGGLSGAGQLGPTSLVFQPRPADAAASSPLGHRGGQWPFCTRSLRPRPSRDLAVVLPAVALFLAPFHSSGYI